MILKEDLNFQLIFGNDPVFQKSSLYGKTYEIKGVLRTPLNTEIKIQTIWIVDNSSGKTKFITLFPCKEK
ncbi:MAG: hypothetical protein A2X61_06355 [Ignavibacteria bacterium GWB2_35_12]|nr:MAG: hypothetical protein A2X63_00165 [Ignavibacteria bacterium GWA2_35_8]OGU37867.1 MAG: hypothetical protein A2X61_06355 [Ignavibacteria bacterium GWB2_35_12]OGU97029.1 MAG: hypothetical protein A2220_11335 [Ignavibacteria bacterium RIFOXYA2_FULL_35_10]OGV18865.1 MAG: hypothetical protein A2475_11250 [Ignavibacteria bacterium RIFOXYC2_FULL_35_21]